MSILRFRVFKYIGRLAYPISHPHYMTQKRNFYIMEMLAANVKGIRVTFNQPVKWSSSPW
jgi:hypothetical protein